MARVSLRNNPLLAALLGTIVTGLGHLYLRRWLRAIGWLGVTVIASVLFAPASTRSAINSGTFTDLFSILPIVLVSAASILDAYFIAKGRSHADRVQANNTTEPKSTDDPLTCPACRKPVKRELGFCHWCATKFKDVEATELEQLDENQST
jgi:hypothetical protein